MLDECIIVNEGLKVKLYPDKVMVDEFNQSLGNARFVWNNLLTEYQKTFELFKQHGYTRLKCNQTTFNTMLTMLKKQYP
ncbi:MAG: helix-turn-helix domain-containing protein, partial [Methanobrevibacter sp.]|nr:helix-turn-helix domain-containing protein [Methanobrevibacter sp.]